jgi:hypothetical protein
MLKKIGIVFLSLILLTILVLIGLGIYFRSKASGSEYHPSGVNSHFTFDTSKPFKDYIAYKINIIKKGNLHYLKAKKAGKEKTAQRIIKLNAPYMTPARNTCKKPVALLMITDPRYGSTWLREVSQSLQQKHPCWSTYGLMLTGSGTRPGDLLHASAKDWQHEVNYAIATIKAAQPNTRIVIASNFSSARLALLAAHQHSKTVKALVLFHPYVWIHGKNKFAGVYGWLNPWVSTQKEDDWAYYWNRPRHFIYQTYRLWQQVRALPNSHLPVYAAFTLNKNFYYNDDIKTMQWLLNHFSNAQFLIYAKDSAFPASLQNDPRITRHSAQYPPVGTQSLSSDPLGGRHVHHMSNLLSLSPQHGYYGVTGDYKICYTAKAGKYTRIACPQDVSQLLFDDSPKDSKLYQAVFFNPYFSDMMQRVNKFLDKKLITDAQ